MENEQAITDVVNKLANQYRPKRLDEDSAEYADNIFGDWKEFQIVVAEHYNRIMVNRFQAMLDELDALGKPSDNLHNVSRVIEIIKTHWPSGMEIYLEGMKNIPPKFAFHFLCFGSELASAMLDIIQDDLKSNSNYTDILKALRRYVSQTL